MSHFMRNTLVLAGLLILTLPLLAQNPPAQPPPSPTPTQNPPIQNPPAQTQAPPNPQPDPPVLEKPQEAAPDEDKEEKKEPAAAAGAKTAAPKTPVTKPVVKTGEGKTVEEIVARVNNEIITRSELEKARASAEDESRAECQGRCSAEQLQVAIEDRQKFALRDLIDQSLLSQRGKDMGINVEGDVVKQLDQIRIQNKLPDMDALERAVTSQGINWDDFKTNIRNRILTQSVIGQEVGRHITIGHEEEMKYYNEHKSEFVRPEQVALSAIEIKTEGKKESEIPTLKEKANTVRKKALDGEDFSELAKRYSDGSTAAQGGQLGVYKRGELSKELEDTVFVMKKNQLTDVIETKSGFLILKVMEHYTEGEQPFDVVEPEIQERLYSQRMEPAMREYLKTLREQSYVVVKPNYQEMSGGGNSEIEEVSTSPEATKEKKSHKLHIPLIPKHKSQAAT
jgi:peptidyl-prolyl cis-trans isomerase SurA